VGYFSIEIWGNFRLKKTLEKVAFGLQTLIPAITGESLKILFTEYLPGFFGKHLPDRVF